MTLTEGTDELLKELEVFGNVEKHNENDIDHESCLICELKARIQERLKVLKEIEKRFGVKKDINGKIKSHFSEISINTIKEISSSIERLEMVGK